MTDLTGRQILVVEDLYYLAMDVKHALQTAGAEVVGPFPSHRAAARSLAERLPDGAVLDVNLGEGASFELARSLRTASVPFLFFTGYDPGVIPPEFADVPRLEKPVDDARLLMTVRACLSDRAGDRA